MGMKKHTYVMTGIKLTPEMLETQMIDIFSDKLLPLVEGHKDVSLSIVYGEGSSVYAGKIVAKSEPYSDDVSQELQFPSRQEVANELRKYGFKIESYSVNNWFFDIWR
jgi:hypothetical protein